MRIKNSLRSEKIQSMQSKIANTKVENTSNIKLIAKLKLLCMYLHKIVGNLFLFARVQNKMLYIAITSDCSIMADKIKIFAYFSLESLTKNCLTYMHKET